MKLQKYLLLAICNSIFRFSIYAAMVAITFVTVFGKPEDVKQAFIRSDAYQRFIPSVIETNLQSQQGGSSLPLKDPKVQEIINRNFSPESLQVSTETVIDSSYKWLNGRTEKPDFVVDFSPNIQNLADQLSAYGFARLKSKPICAVEPTTTDPFTDNCRPEFLDYQAEQKNLAEIIRSNNGILPQQRFTANDLPKNADGQDVLEQYSYAPAAFQALQYSPWIFGVAAFASGMTIIYSSRKRYAALGRLGASVVGSSVFIVLSPLLFVYVIPRFFPAFASQSTGNPTQIVLGDVSARLNSSFINQLIITGVLLIVLGFAIILISRTLQPKSKYIAVNKKAGVISSNAPRNRKGKLRTSYNDVPVQTSEGQLLTSKYQKDKRYRKIPKGDL